MPNHLHSTGRAGPSGLRWQSQLVLLATVPILGVWVTLAGGDAWIAHDPMLAQAALISIGFAALVWLLRAATLGGAITGAIITAALYLQTPGWHTALWPLLALFLLTFAATRFGRSRKEALGTAEGKRGRTSSQVAANLGVAALAGIPISTLHVFSPTTFDSRAALVAMLAALAEATADTLSSELGQVLGGEPRLVTNLQPVPAGTDGAITFIGTLAGCAGAALVVGSGAMILPVTGSEALLAGGAGVAGLFIDSLLGAIPERRGWLNNDAVNALSTLAAALIAAWFSRFLLGGAR
jgi:uncharacterized protein (TIGR00297 family)